MIDVSWFFIKYRWLRERSFLWLLKRLLNEWQSPTINQIKRAKFFVKKTKTKNNISKLVKSKTLFFILDLQIVPISFDVASYCALAELERRRKGLQNIHVIFVPGYLNGLRLEMDGYDSVVNLEARRWRLSNLVLPVIGLLPSVKSYSFCQNRTDAVEILQTFAHHIYPNDWTNDIPTRPKRNELIEAVKNGEKVLPILLAPPCAKEYVEQYLKSIAAGKLIVITLRSYDYTPKRNSDIKSWARFAKELEQNKYCVVFLLDTETSLNPVPDEMMGFNVFLAGSWNIHLRMAIYQRAYLNMAIAQGPMELMFFNDQCRYLIFFPINTAPLTSTKSLHGEGFIIGEDLPFSEQRQHIFWGLDSYENISSEFSKFVKIMEEQ